MDILAIVNNVAKNVDGQISVQVPTFNSLGIYCWETYVFIYNFLYYLTFCHKHISFNNLKNTRRYSDQIILILLPLEKSCLCSLSSFVSWILSSFHCWSTSSSDSFLKLFCCLPDTPLSVVHSVLCLGFVYFNYEFSGLG